MLVILLEHVKKKKKTMGLHLVGIMLRQCKFYSYIPFYLLSFVMFVRTMKDENVERHLSELYSIFYLYLKIDITKRKANECCDVMFFGLVFFFQKVLVYD